MNDERPTFRTTRGFWLSVPLAAALTWLAHEFAHYQAGRWLGYDMWMSINQVGLIEGEYGSREHRMLVAMAGPLVTYLQAGIALWLILARKSALAYIFLYLAFFMRLVAFGLGISKPNDEARTSLDLGLPVWVLPTIFVGMLLIMTIVGSRSLRVRWQTNVLLYFAASLMATAIVFSDPLIGRILG